MIVLTPAEAEILRATIGHMVEGADEELLRLRRAGQHELAAALRERAGLYRSILGKLAAVAPAPRGGAAA